VFGQEVEILWHRPKKHFTVRRQERRIMIMLYKRYAVELVVEPVVKLV